jgi:hypothetical protein
MELRRNPLTGLIEAVVEDTFVHLTLQASVSSLPITKLRQRGFEPAFEQTHFVIGRNAYPDYIARWVRWQPIPEHIHPQPANVPSQGDAPTGHSLSESELVTLFANDYGQPTDDHSGFHYWTPEDYAAFQADRQRPDFPERLQQKLQAKKVWDKDRFPDFDTPRDSRDFLDELRSKGRDRNVDE